MSIKNQNNKPKYEKIKSFFDTKKIEKIFTPKYINWQSKLINNTKIFLSYQLINKAKSLKNKLSITELYQNTQNLIEKKVEGEKTQVFLKESTTWAKYICWSIVGGTLFGISWLCFAKTEEIIIATGKIEPIEGLIEIKIPVRGVTSEILIKEGEKVKKGQLLIRLDTEANDAKSASLNKNKEITLEILKRLKILVEEGAVSELQYLEQENKLAQIESAISENNVNIKYQKILAPANGLIFDLKPRKPGFVADPSQPILKIVPEGKLRANVEIQSRSIGFVSVGKLADISIDSFPATDFGVITGRIESISSDALAPDPRTGKGYRFPAKISLDNQYLQVKNKTKLPLQVGMSLTANIKLRKVSYLQLLLNTFQDRTDSLRVM